MARLHRLYEQKKTSADCDVVLGEYVRRWQRWAKVGLNNSDVLQNVQANKTPHDGGVLVLLDVTLRKLLNAAFPSSDPEYHKT